MADSPLKDTPLAGQTVKYGDVQFGGSDAIFKGSRLNMMPPEYDMQGGDLIYDEADRACTHTRYVLRVNTVVYAAGDDEPSQSRQMDILHDKLSEPGKRLILGGLGCGFQGVRTDIIWGPKPRVLRLKPVGGKFAWELDWAVEFNLNMRHQFGGSASDDDAVMAFNFRTRWQYSFEGIATRTISGYILTPQTRDDRNPHRLGSIQKVADNRRHVVKVDVPVGMRRLDFGFDENAAKNRLDFFAVDRQFDAESFPVGCSDAAGNYTIAADGPGLNQGRATLNVSLTTRPGISRANALPIFLKIALAKQAALLRAAVKNPGEKSLPLVDSLVVSHRLFTRTTDFSISWKLVRCVQNFMFEGGIWEPVAGTGFKQWQADMSKLWDQRGAAPGLQSLLDEQVIIDLQNGADVPIIGKGPPGFDAPVFAPNVKFPCPDDLPAEMTWLDYDVRLRVYRKDPSVLHRKAVSRDVEELKPKAPLAWDDPRAMLKLTDDGKLIVVPREQHVIETTGVPITYIGLQFKGLRIKLPPQPPILKSVSKKPVLKLMNSHELPWHAFSILDCPVYAYRFWALYRITEGVVTEVKPTGTMTKCGGTPPPKSNVLEY